MTVKKKYIFVGFLAVFLALLVSCLEVENWNDLVIPKEKLLEPLVDAGIEIAVAEDKQYETEFIPKYSGRYIAYLDLKRRHPTYGNDAIVDKFTVAGVCEIRGNKDVLIYEGGFNDLMTSGQVGLTLAKFEIDRKQVGHSGVFQVVFSEGAEKLDQHYSEITFVLQKRIRRYRFLD